MKHQRIIRRLAAAAAALVLAVSCAGALAAGDPSAPAAASATVAELLDTVDFKFFVREEGIGRGSAPVYTAPSEDSLRLSDGRAACNVEEEIAVAGRVDGWLMVRYEIGSAEEKDRKVRVGYIPPKYSKGYKAGIGKREFDSIPVKLAEAIDITDNPRHNSTPFGTLDEGTDIIILGKYTYTGNWWYVETTLEGKLTRGFIDRSSAALLVDGTVYHGNLELGIPVTSPRGTRVVGTVTVNGTSQDALIVRQGAGTDTQMVARAHGGDVFPCYGSEVTPREKTWYYIWVDGVWGWFAAGNAAYTEGYELAGAGE